MKKKERKEKERRKREREEKKNAGKTTWFRKSKETRRQVPSWQRSSVSNGNKPTWDTLGHGRHGVN